MATESFERYEGTADYIASDDLKQAVNVSIALGRPLLIKGEPGTGKTLLARSIAEGLDLPIIQWTIKSTTKAMDGLYIYDTVQRLYDSRFNDKDVGDISQYIRMGPVGRAFTTGGGCVLLIDEVDKADLEFPNDLLAELDQMSFVIPETGRVVSAAVRPIVVITSNAEKELPDAFLRRCVFHYIAFPERELMADIIRVHYPDIEDKLLAQVISSFYWLRTQDAFRKKPSTSELLDWILALIRSGFPVDRIQAELPFVGALLKSESDHQTLTQARTGSHVTRSNR